MSRRMAKTRFQKAKALCPQLPWCNDNAETLGPVVQQYLYDQETFFRRWAKRMFENFQFVMGNSTIKWSRGHDYAVDVDFLNRNNTTQSQRASTNISRVVVEALSSLIYSNLPAWDAETSEESSQKGIRYASIVQKLLDAYMTRLMMEKEFSSASLIFTTFSQVAARVDFSKRAGGMIERPRFRRVQAPVSRDYMGSNPFTGGLFEVASQAMDSSGQPQMEDRWEPVLDQFGRQLREKERSGDVKVTMLTPLEYRRAIGSTGMHNTKFVEHIRLIDYDEYLKDYGDLGGRTRFYDSVHPGFSDRGVFSFAVQHFMRMQTMAPPSMEQQDGEARGAVLSGSHFRNKVLVVEHFDEPDDEVWPLGRRLVIANGQCTHITVPQYHTNKPDGWHPFIEAQWMAIPPNSMSTGPMDGVTAKNRELNVYDSLMATAARRDMGSVLLVKTAGGLDPNKLTGEPGQHVQVNDVMGAARYLQNDTPLPASVPATRQSIKDDIYEVSGAMDALRGDRSKGVSSGYALTQLREREERRLTPPRKAFEFFGSGIGEKVIICLKQNVIKLDDDIIGYLQRKAAGEFQIQDVLAFLQAPMEFGIDLKIESGSMVEKSKATKQADYMELAKGPAKHRIESNAEVLDKFLKYFGAERLRDDSAPHRERAQRENEILSDVMRIGPNAAGLKMPLVIFEDDDQIHMAKHTDFMVRNSDEIFANKWFLEQVLLHIETHRLQDQEKQAKLLPGASLSAPQMMQQAQQVPPPGGQQITQHAIAQAQNQMKSQGPQPAKPGTPDQRQSPQAPRSPAPVGSGGPGPQTAGAPSQNTQTANYPKGGV